MGLVATKSARWLSGPSAILKGPAARHGVHEIQVSLRGHAQEAVPDLSRSESPRCVFSGFLGSEEREGKGNEMKTKAYGCLSQVLQGNPFVQI